MKTCAAIALTLILLGCAGTRPQIGAQQLGEVRKGETRLAEVVSRFGRPDILLKNLDGTQTAAYLTGEGSRLAMIAALAGSGNANVDSVIFHFDPGGALDDYRTTHRNQASPVAAEAAGTAPVQATVPSQALAPAQSSSPAAGAPASGPARPAAAAQPPARAAYTTRDGESMFLPGNGWTTHVFEPPEPKAGR